MALRHMTHTCTSSFLQTSREFFRVRRLGRVFERVTKVELARQIKLVYIRVYWNRLVCLYVNPVIGWWPIQAEPTSHPWQLGYSPAEPWDPSVAIAGTEDRWMDYVKILSLTWLSVERLVEQMRMGREGCSLRGDPRWSDSTESRWKQAHLQTLTAHHQTWTHKLWPLLGWSYLITEKDKKQEKNPLAWLHIERRTNTRQERPDLDFLHSETPSPTYTETGDRVKEQQLHWC